MQNKEKQGRIQVYGHKYFSSEGRTSLSRQKRRGRAWVWLFLARVINNHAVLRSTGPNRTLNAFCCRVVHHTFVLYLTQMKTVLFINKNTEGKTRN